MVNTNYVASIVKILENPNQFLLKNNIQVTKFRVQLPQLRNTRIVNLIVWGNLTDNRVKYYRINDYILIEGYLSLNKNHRLSKFDKDSKKVEITVLKIYPFLMDPNSQISNK